MLEPRSAGELSTYAASMQIPFLRVRGGRSNLLSEARAEAGVVHRHQRLGELLNHYERRMTVGEITGRDWMFIA